MKNKSKLGLAELILGSSLLYGEAIQAMPPPHTPFTPGTHPAHPLNPIWTNNRGPQYTEAEKSEESISPWRYVLAGLLSIGASLVTLGICHGLYQDRVDRKSYKASHNHH